MGSIHPKMARHRGPGEHKGHQWTGRYRDPRAQAQPGKGRAPERSQSAERKSVKDEQGAPKPPAPELTPDSDADARDLQPNEACGKCMAELVQDHADNQDHGPAEDVDESPGRELRSQDAPFRDEEQLGRRSRRAP